MAEIQHLEATATTGDITDVLVRDGAVILDNVMGSDELDRLKAELSPYLAQSVYGQDEFTGFKTQRIGALIARSEACGDVALHPLMLASARQYLKDFCDDIQLHFTSAVAISGKKMTKGPSSQLSKIIFSLYVWFYVPKERIVTLIVVTGCEGPSTMVRNPTYAVLSRNQFCRELRAR